MGGRDPKSLVRAIGEGSHWTQGTDRGIIRNTVQKILNTLFNLSRFQASWKSKKAYWTRSLPYNLWMDLLLYLTAYYIIFVVHNWYNFDRRIWCLERPVHAVQHRQHFKECLVVMSEGCLVGSSDV